jgi:predicted outer membrane repeat protein
MDSVYVTSNTAVKGGGIEVSNTTNNNIIRNSTISGNTGTNACGGINVASSASLTIVNSTISGNSGSGAAGNGGGICAEGAVTLRSSTVTGNTAGQGGGIYVGSTGSLDFGGSIVAGNSATGLAPEIFQQIAMSVISSGFNLVGDSTGDSSSTNAAIAYQISSDILDTDPLLDTFGNNGGAVPTFALRGSPMSPAIDKGKAFGQLTDQRGFARTFDDPAIANASGGDGTDIGAVERLSPTAARVGIAGRVLTIYGAGMSGVRIVLTSPERDEPRTALTNGFGYYAFDDLEAGKAYIVSAEDGRRRFRTQTRFIFLADQMDDADFTIEP